MVGNRLEVVFGNVRNEPIARCAQCGQPLYEDDVAVYFPERKEYFCDPLCLARWLIDTGIVEEVEVEAPNRPDPMQRRDQ